MRYSLKILPNKLLVCSIAFTNPDTNLSFTCDGLIDTGAEMSIMCSSIFAQLSFKPESSITCSTIDKDEAAIITSAIFAIPHNNWNKSLEFFAVRDLAMREEYKAIIGMDILSKFQLVFNGKQGVAWLE